MSDGRPVRSVSQIDARIRRIRGLSFRLSEISGRCGGEEPLGIRWALAGILEAQGVKVHELTTAGELHAAIDDIADALRDARADRAAMERDERLRKAGLR